MVTKMIFGTINSLRWITPALSGANMGSEGWAAEGTTLNGQGFVRNSRGSHKEYLFEWGIGSPLLAAQLMKSYRDGVYGDGPYYFVDPNIYNKNVLPARWAFPGMVTNDEGPSHVDGVQPDSIFTSGWQTNDLPTTGAQYDLSATTAGYRDDFQTVFIPIPPGFTLHLGAFYSKTGTGGVFVSPVSSLGAVGAAVALTELAVGATEIVADTFSGGAGVRIWFGRSTTTASTLTVRALIGRLIPTAQTPSIAFLEGPWIGGMGNAGCKFVGVPTMTATSSFDGGMAGYAVTLKEAEA